jgi:diguanylate cyclase (GGDEF)-like protein
MVIKSILISTLLSAGVLFVYLQIYSRKHKNINNTLKKVEEEYENALHNEKEIEKTLSQYKTYIKKILYLYELTKRISQILDFEQIVRVSAESIKEYIGAESVKFYTIKNDSPVLLLSQGKADKDDKLLSKEELLSIKKITISPDKENTLWLPIWCKGEFLGLFVVDLPPKQNTEELLIESNILVNQLVLGFEKSNLYSKIEELARTDGLTNLYRRHYFFQCASEEYRRAVHDKTGFCVAICDIDHFKKCNDTYGHQVGDFILSHIAQILKENFYETDIIGRYGGEEFIMLFPRSDIEGLERKINFVREKISKEKIETPWGTVSVTVSFGVAAYPANGKTLEEVVHCADKALYYSKTHGRNCVTVFSKIKE